MPFPAGFQPASSTGFVELSVALKKGSPITDPLLPSRNRQLLAPFAGQRLAIHGLDY